ncbi:MAG: bifunctional metallophosphatase/5'-nucleotidase [Bacteroidia bacterium]|nr:bifunctional metallophosphatase/5'-nucleotidase [Bacteroidia bacterium]
MNRRSFILFFILLPLFWSCKSTRITSNSAGTTTEITLLHINDVYEIAALEGGKSGGMARVATLRNQLKAQNPHTYTVLAGDFLNPSVIGTVKLDGKRVRGAHMVDIMNHTGVDLVTFGNHEFDIPEEDLIARINEAKFEWISGNIRHKTSENIIPFTRKTETGEVPLPEYTIWQIKTPTGKTLRLGVLAVCLNANPVDFVHYEEEFAYTEKVYQHLQTQTDFVIALTHLSLNQDQELARRLPDLKLIMGGHEHENHFEKIGTVPIAKADANAKSAYVHRITFREPSGGVTISSELVQLNESVALDPAVDARVKDWEKRAYAAFSELGFEMNKIVTTVTEPLDGFEKTIRTRPTNLGVMIAEAMFAATKNPDCALVNGGSVRIDDQLSGNITEFDIVRALPFGGGIVTVEMRGKLLKQLLDAGEKNRGTGGYLQTYKISTEGNYWYMDGKIIEDESNYRVATTDFLLTGLEANMSFFTKNNPGIISVDYPGPGDLSRDIRLALVDYLKKR